MFDTLMHIAFFTDHIDEMIDFYVSKLGCKLKAVTRMKVYLNRPDRPKFQQMAQQDPERIMNAYLEIAPGQFIELFPAEEGQKKDEEPWNSRLGYSHFALVTDDIFAKVAELKAKGVTCHGEPSKGPSETWQCWFSDPDGNRFEVMQYTERSIQIIGNL